MNLVINDELLAILLLYSLPASYETFRCAMEARDELPKPEALKVKILEESEARSSKPVNEGAMFARKGFQPAKKIAANAKQNTSESKQAKPFRFKCYKCFKIDHRAAECRANRPEAMAAEAEERALHCVDNSSSSMQKWCLDSGATSHMTAIKQKFGSLVKLNNSLTMANH